MPVAKIKNTKADTKAAVRKVTAKVTPKREQPEFCDHLDTFGIIHRAMNSAAKKAVAENNRLGIPTPVADAAGNIVYR